MYKSEVKEDQGTYGDTRQDMQTMRSNLLYIEERYRGLQEENARLLQREQSLLQDLNQATRASQQHASNAGSQ